MAIIYINITADDISSFLTFRCVGEKGRGKPSPLLCLMTNNKYEQAVVYLYEAGRMTGDNSQHYS